MPELPEVETTVRDLKPQLVGRRIIGAAVKWERSIAIPTAREFIRQIKDYKVVDITRRGKYLRFCLRRGKESRSLFVHLRMTGGFRVDVRAEPRDKHMHVVLWLDNGKELRFRDPRKFGRMWLVAALEDALVVGKLGPEPLEITRREFVNLFERRRGNLKPLLLDQTFLAGLGNIYADEALWYAKLHPLRRAESLTRAERTRLYRAIQKVLHKAIDVGGTSIDVMYKRVNGASGGFQDSLRAYERADLPCRRCGTPIRKTVVAQRGTHYCPRCQVLE